MKIARKVLSVLLAVAMILSTVAASASAVIGNADSAYQVKFWITAKKVGMTFVYDDEEGYMINDPEEIGEETTGTDGVVEVAAGDYYDITFYADTNFYTTYMSAALYFSNGLEDIKEIWYDDLGYTDNDPEDWGIGVSFNSENKFVNTACKNSSIAALALRSEQQTEAVKANLFDTVKDENGVAYFAADDYLKYDSIQMLLCPNYGTTYKTTYKLNNSTGTKCSLFHFIVRVPETAKAGDEFSFFIPQEARKTATSGHMFVGKTSGDSISKCYSYDCDTDSTVLGSEQYFDLTGTNLTLKIPGGTGGTTTLDRTALETTYNTYKDTVLDNYKDGIAKTDFQTALAAAKDELDNKQETAQEAINAIKDNLVEKAELLELKDIDKTALKTLIDASDLCTLEDYANDAAWGLFQTALTDAKSVYNDTSLTTILQQGTVNEAYDELETAKNNLNELAVADYSTLDNLITEFEGKTEAWYTPGTWSTANTAYINAKGVTRNLKATDANQTTINNAASALSTALQGLAEADANYATLLETYNACVDYAQSSYKSGWTAFAEARATAKGLLDNQTLKVKDQQTINDANTALADAVAALVPYGSADYSALQNSVNTKPTYFSYGAAYYDNWNEYDIALTAAQALLDNQNLDESQQQTINDAKTALDTAYANLALKDADYTAVNNAITACPSAEDLAAYYEEGTVTTLTNLIQNVDWNLKINDQDDVTAYAEQITIAKNNLVLLKADVTELGKAITAAEAKDSAYFESDSFGEMTTVLDDAKALFANAANLTKKDNQAQVDQMTKDLNDKVAALVSLGANYTDLKTQIDDYESRTESNYTQSTWAEAKTAYNNAKTAYATLGTVNQYTKAQQEDLNVFTNALAQKLAALELKPAVYTALETAITKADDVIADSWKYEQSYLDGITAPLATAKGVSKTLKIDEQQTINEAAEALEAALANPVYSGYDYETLRGYETTWLSIVDNADNYKKAPYDNCAAAYANLVWTYTNNDDDYAAAQLQDSAFSAILAKVVAADPANYAEVTKAENAANLLNQKDYTDASWATLQLALAKVGTKNLNENHQTEVDTMANDINDAIANLKVLASYTDLDGQIAVVADFLETATIANYETQTVNDLNTAYSAATTISRQLTTDEQNQVNKAYTDLKAAYEALTLKTADFVALQAEIDKFAAKNEADYTSASWSNYATAVALGMKAIKDKLDITKQSEVNTLKDNIITAEGNLTQKASSGKGVYEAPTGNVKDLSAANTFTFRVNDRAQKVQFVDDNGNTWTYTRNASKVSIDSYDDAGNKVAELSGDLAYEDWNITQWLPAGHYTIKAKYITDKEYGNIAAWDDVNTSEMTVAVTVPTDVTVYSYTLESATGSIGAVNVSVNTGLDVVAVQVRYDDGQSTATVWNSTTDGVTKTFNLKAICRNWGDNEIQVYAIYANAYHNVGTLTYTAVQ